MKLNIKAAVALALGVLAVSEPVQAEDFNLFNYKHWSVDYVDLDGYRYCRMRNSGSKLGFGLNVDEYGEMHLQVWDAEVDYEGWNGTFAIAVDRRRGWTVNGYGERNSIFAEIGHVKEAGSVERRFLDALTQGRQLYVLENGAPLSEYHYKFSLAGSKAAGDAMASCVRKL